MCIDGIDGTGIEVGHQPRPGQPVAMLAGPVLTHQVHLYTTIFIYAKYIHIKSTFIKRYVAGVGSHPSDMCIPGR